MSDKRLEEIGRENTIRVQPTADGRTMFVVTTSDGRYCTNRRRYACKIEKPMSDEGKNTNSQRKRVWKNYKAKKVEETRSRKK